jgi:hypothetical protein
MWGLANWPYQTWLPLIVGPALFLGSLPLLAHIATRTAGDVPFSLLASALALKLLSAAAYLVLTNVLYHGVADFTLYDDKGTELAQSYRHGDWNFDVPVPGYGFIQILTGLVYRVTGTSLLAAFFVFSWLAFWGLVMIVLAARTAVPEANIHRYGLLVLLLPSTLYWSSAVGKDAWMTLAIGLFALGAARLLVRRRGALLLLGLALLAAGLVRPHISLMLFVGLTAAYLARRSPGSLAGPMGKVLGIAVLGIVGLVIVQHAKSFLGLDELSIASVNQSLARAGESSAGGGSSIDPPVGGSVTRLPWAVLTVVLRPFPWEATNPQTLVTSLEGAALVLASWWNWPRLRSLPRMILRRPYLLFVITYSALFVFAFSSLANLGTMARQRVQLLPLLLLVLCLPERRPANPDTPLGSAAPHGSTSGTAMSGRG